VFVIDELTCKLMHLVSMQNAYGLTIYVDGLFEDNYHFCSGF